MTHDLRKNPTLMSRTVLPVRLGGQSLTVKCPTLTLMSALTFATLLLALFMSLLPIITFAQYNTINSATNAQPKTFGEFVIFIIDTFLFPIPAIIITLGLIAFFWGIIKYVFSAGSAEKLQEGRNIMIYGVIAMFVMVSVWGLVAVLKRTFFPLDYANEQSNVERVRTGGVGNADSAPPRNTIETFPIGR